MVFYQTRGREVKKPNLYFGVLKRVKNDVLKMAKNMLKFYIFRKKDQTWGGEGSEGGLVEDQTFYGFFSDTFPNRSQRKVNQVTRN